MDRQRVGKIRRGIRGDAFDTESLTVRDLRCCTLRCLTDRVPGPHRRAEGVGAGDIVPLGPKFERGFRIALDEGCQRAVILLYTSPKPAILPPPLIPHKQQ